MPNWCEGKLKIRGQQKDIVQFIRNGLQPLNTQGLLLSGTPIKETQDEDFLYFSCDQACYIDNTDRGFIESFHVEFDKVNDNTTPLIMVFPARFAWEIAAEQLFAICKTYHVDMRIYAYEQGMEFNQHIEIVDGKLIHDEKITFDDYVWECPEPDIGG